MNPNTVGKKQEGSAFSKSIQITQEGYVFRLVNTGSKETDFDKKIDHFQEGFHQVARILRGKIGYSAVGMAEVYDISIQTPEVYRWFSNPNQEGIKALLSIENTHRLTLSEVSVTFPLAINANAKAVIYMHYRDDFESKVTTITLQQKNIETINEAQSIATNTYGSPLPSQIAERIIGGETIPCWYVEVDTRIVNEVSKNFSWLKRARDILS